MIAVFGASVTQQKNGFARKMRQRIEDNVKVYGYGGMHLNNAGICFIDNVLKDKPIYCFIDWFSTGYNETNQETLDSIDTIIHKFNKKNCKLIFLFLPSKDIEKRRKFHLFCKRYLGRRGNYYIDLNSEIKPVMFNSILRDNVHTTDYGSDLYCKIISRKFKENNERITYAKEIKKTHLVDIKKLEIERVFTSLVQLSGKCKIIGFELTIGPHSGIVEVAYENMVEKYNTWDRWCHYPRRHFNLSLELTGHVTLKVSQERFDTGTCNQNYNFDVEKKKLIIHNIYYVGNNLTVNNIHDGLKIKKSEIFIRLIKGRIMQKKNKMLKRIGW